MTETPGRAFYERQLGFLASMDGDELVRRQYHPDATLVTFDKTVHGRGALVDHFRGYLAFLGSFRLLSTDKFVETEDSIMFEATVAIDPGTARVYDVFLLRDGKATHHFSGLISLTPATPAPAAAS